MLNRNKIKISLYYGNAKFIRVKNQRSFKILVNQFYFKRSIKRTLFDYIDLALRF